MDVETRRVAEVVEVLDVGLRYHEHVPGAVRPHPARHDRERGFVLGDNNVVPGLASDHLADSTLVARGRVVVHLSIFAYDRNVVDSEPATWASAA